jgi:uncharacterized protein (DUF1697 family)
MAAFVSLFRAVNVGGRQVKMDALRALHESLSLQRVLPYIQSGNVVFESDDADAARIRGEIEAAFKTTFGFHSDVFVRALADLEAVIAASPFAGHLDKAPNHVVVMFLAAHPDAAAQDALRAAYAGPEEIFIIGQEVHMYYPEGQGRSKLTNTLLEKKLKTVGTARNWNTVLKLHNLLQARNG